jgi:pilus assembly protein CpaE
MSGDLLVLFGAKGGVGASTLATRLGLQLAGADTSVAVVDLDLHSGDLYGALDLPATLTLVDVLEEIDGLEGEALRRRLPRHPSGLYALSQANRLEQLEGASWSSVAELLRRMRRSFDVVMVDGVRDFGDEALAAVDEASLVALVTTPDIPSVRGAARARTVLHEIGCADEKLALIVNRHRRRAPLPDAAIVEAVGIRPVAAVAEAPRALGPAAGRAVALDGRVGRTLASLAARLRAQVAHAAAGPEPATRKVALPPSRWSWRWPWRRRAEST